MEDSPSEAKDSLRAQMSNCFGHDDLVFATHQPAFGHWYYADPKDIPHQINLYTPCDEETKELFKVLEEEIKLANAGKMNQESYEEYTRFEFKRYSYANYAATEELISELKIVKDSLCKDPKYQEQCLSLPDIKID